MGPLKNSRYEKFAQMVASGLTGSEAYRQVAGATAGKNADVLAARWMDSPGVRERLNELKEANSRKATLSREQTILRVYFPGSNDRQDCTFPRESAEAGCWRSLSRHSCACQARFGGSHLFSNPPTKQPQ
jgi:hypothetical protein